jgi:hypothetical protein
MVRIDDIGWIYAIISNNFANLDGLQTAVFQLEFM